MSESPDHTNRDHAEFSPSSLKYVAACPGYEGREGTSAAAEKGTRIHEALEVMDPSALHDEEELSIYEQIVEDERAFLTNVMGDDYLDKHTSELYEVRVDVDLGDVSTWGTCDRLTLCEDRGVMGDYKTGISIIDTPRKNWQAKAYALGAFQKYPKLEHLVFVFYVPVRDQVLEDVFFRSDVPELVDELATVIKRGQEVRPQWEGGQPDIDDLNPTVNCRFCKHEDHCPSLGGLALDVASKLSSSILPDTDIENPEDPQVVETLWAIAKIVSNWSTRIKAKAVAMAKEGVEFPSLQLKSMGAPKKCNDTTSLIKIAEEYGVDQEAIFDLANIPLKKLADEVSKTAPEGEKGKKAKDFLDAVNEAGIITVAETRYTLS